MLLLIYVIVFYARLTCYLVHSLHILKQRAWFIRGTGNQIYSMDSTWWLLGNHTLTRDLQLERFARNISAISLWVPSHCLWISCFYWTWELRLRELTWNTIFRMVDGLSYALCTFHVWYMCWIYRGFGLACALIVICMLFIWNPQNKHNDRFLAILTPLRYDLCSSVYLSHVAM